MSPVTKKIVFSSLLLLVNISVFAQQTVRPPAPQRTAPVGRPLPIDGGVLILLALGAALGIWFYYKRIKVAKAV